MEDCEFDSDNIIPLIINTGAILFTITAIVAIISHGSIDKSLRGILLSFLTANLLTGCAFFYDIVVFSCEYHSRTLTFIFKVSMVLSLAHVLMLILHYHVAITSSKTRKTKVI